MNIIGWFSTFCLTACAIPALYNALRTGRVAESYGLLVLWWLGEASRAIYSTQDLPILVNCAVNLILITPLVWWKYKGRK